MARLKYKNPNTGLWEPITGALGPSGVQGPLPNFGTPTASTVPPVSTTVLGTATVSLSGDGTLGDPIILTLGIPAGLKGDKGDKGDTGQNGAVEVASAEPSDPLINLWVEPDDDLGDSGWVALDGRYFNVTGDTVTGASTFSSTVQVNGTLTANAGAGTLLLKPGSSNHVYMGFYSSTASPSTRSGYMGYGSSGTTQLTINNELTNGPILLATNGTGRVTVSADPTAALGVATKQYVDAKVVVSASAPTSPTTGQIWVPI